MLRYEELSSDHKHIFYMIFMMFKKKCLTIHTLLTNPAALFFNNG